MSAGKMLLKARVAWFEENPTDRTTGPFLGAEGCRCPGACDTKSYLVLLHCDSCAKKFKATKICFTLNKNSAGIMQRLQWEGKLPS